MFSSDTFKQTAAFSVGFDVDAIKHERSSRFKRFNIKNQRMQKQHVAPTGTWVWPPAAAIQPETLKITVLSYYDVITSLHIIIIRRYETPTKLVSGKFHEKCRSYRNIAPTSAAPLPLPSLYISRSIYNANFAKGCGHSSHRASEVFFF